MMADAARGLGWHAFPGPAAINSRSYQNRTGVRVSRLLHPRRLSCERKRLDRRDDDPESGQHETALGRDRGARDQARRERCRPRHRRHVSQGRDRVLSSRPMSCCSRATPTRTCGCCCCRNQSRSRTASRTTTGRSGRHYFSHNTGGAVSALFPRSLNSWYGLPAQGVAVDNWADDNFDHAGVDFIGGGNLWIYSDGARSARRA